MTENYISLRVNRDFGDIITTYFDFFKQNIKKFTNVFLSYNGIFLIGLLIVSYLLVSGFMGVIAYEDSYTYGVAREPMDSKYMILVGIGGIMFLIIFIMVAVLNYGLASSYMIKYEDKQGDNFDKKEVWEYAKSQFGNIVLFILLMIPIFLVLMIISIILAFIPLVGIFANYISQFFIQAWLGVSFYDMLQNKKGVTDALGEGWSLVTKNFWRSIGVNFILGLLIGVLIMVALIVPGVIIGVYTFHVVENDVAYSTSIVATVIYTLGTSLFLIIAVYGQCLSQFVNGILYYALHEKTYNVNTRSKIEEIGNNKA
ncbi:hypothetical protein [Croceitalea rosinachiae]|uniref:Glycerophosphoryl diester phosphodiesterase membrane domain-containing protein n=1 Tax=Croceitalea rosinachiae TaxID=3075596 RepID=A0ABU3AI25_9FLAO|nr:hypothetical protein [Croceitalea sp. F388]MDT0608551.1 hypothetical protein [Croceitalea sp. F388]